MELGPEGDDGDDGLRRSPGADNDADDAMGEDDEELAELADALLLLHESG